MAGMTLPEWLHLGLRWFHLIAGIYWIGASFYFIWLDQQLEAPAAGEKDADLEGSLWMVHSGGFYRVERRRVGPGRMPAVLHWFKWEAMLTWVSGLFLLGLLYYSTRGLYLVDPAVSGIPTWGAIAVGLATVFLGWGVYDGIWSSLGDRRPVTALAISLLLLAGVCVALTATLSGRAAYIHVGAMLGTIMVNNVWMRILPAQSAMIRATAEGREPDFTNGERAKRRSVHNSYVTFPVLFTMLSSHFPGTYGGAHAAALLLLLIAIGMMVRYLMIGSSPRRRVWWVPLGASVIAAVLLASPTAAPAPPLDATTRAALAGEGDPPAFAEVEAVITARCVACHASQPRLDLYGAAPGGVNFEKPGEVARYADRIVERTVRTRTMPLGNMTAMPDGERLLLARWAGHGAPTE